MRVSPGAGGLPPNVALAQEVNRYIAAAVPRMHEFGIRVIELEEGRVVAEVPLVGNTNHLGTMYAGTLFAVAEMLGGALVWPNFDFGRYYSTVKEVLIGYCRPAHTDIRATATLDTDTIARLYRDVATAGRAEYVVDAILTDCSGEVVATSRGTYQVRAH